MSRTLERQFIQERAYSILKNAYGPGAQFHPGQLDAIVSVVSGRDSLVVEKTGWGKSLVYFVSTKILRENGAGPTLIISPLLALMENQVESARIFGVDAVTVSSDNKDQWDDIYRNLNRVDALIVSPERLSNEQFMRHLAEVPGIELVVVDEAHSISDWGHDFRPDYQRVSKIIDGLPGNVTVLGTTATANDRVISDIKEQMGGNLEIVRGDLIRENLAIQVNPLQTREQRLAWLAQMLVGDEILSNGQGIIYCLTHSDCTAVADFLSERGVSILPYYSGMGEDERGMSIEKQNLASFVAGETRVLAATVKLGMGYDKSDIRFVIHFQLPQNLIAYYQQIGRAGRDGKPAYAFLLHGEEDEEILTHFIATAQASPNLLKDIVGMARSGVRYGEMLKALNVKGGQARRGLEVSSCPRLPVSGRIRLSCKLREGVRRGGGAGEAGPDHQDANRRARGAYRVPRFDRLLHEARGSRARCPRCARDVRHLRELPGRFHRARKRRSEHRGGSDSVLRRTTWGNSAAQGMGLARPDQAGVADEAGLGAVRRLLFCSGAKGQGGEIHHRVFLWRAHRCIE